MSISAKQITNKYGVTYFQIFRDEEHIANCYRTFHPTIKYEVFWDNATKSQRCNSVKEACQIIADELLPSRSQKGEQIMSAIMVFYNTQTGKFNAVPGEGGLEEMVERGAIQVISRDQNGNIQDFELTDIGLWPLIRIQFIEAIISDAVGAWKDGIESFLIELLQESGYEIEDIPPHDDAEKTLTEILDNLLP